MPVDRPVCWWCSHQRRPQSERLVAAADAVYEALCGHEHCPSLVFHGLCLMEFRESDWVTRIREINEQRIAHLRGEA